MGSSFLIRDIGSTTGTYLKIKSKMTLLEGMCIEMGSNQFRVDMPNLVELYMSGKLKLDDWVSDLIKIEEINEGFTKMKEGKVVRSIIDFGVV